MSPRGGPQGTLREPPVASPLYVSYAGVFARFHFISPIEENEYSYVSISFNQNTRAIPFEAGGSESQRVPNSSSTTARSGARARAW